MAKAKSPLFNRELLNSVLAGAVRKLDPRALWRNPVMFVTALGALACTVTLLAGAFSSFNLQITLWLWFTVLFANFAEALAEGRGKAQAASLRRARTQAMARLLRGDAETRVVATELKPGDLVVCEAGDVIPGDGEVIEGIATVDESAITGESAPVIRESGGDRSAVTGGTRVISDRIVVRVTSQAGNTFLDRMISLVEGARRQKTPNEIALGILLLGLTAAFLLAVATLPALARYSEDAARQPGAARLSLPVLVSLFVCLIPTTIGGLLSAVGISGIDRLLRKNVLATSGRAVEAAGDVDVLLLDKTGTITLGNRMATAFLPAPGVAVERLADAAQLASLADETPEGRSIVVLAKEKFGLRGREVAAPHATFVPFTAQTRMSGVDLAAGSTGHWPVPSGNLPDGTPATSPNSGAGNPTATVADVPPGRLPGGAGKLPALPTRRIRKGAADAVRRFIEEQRGAWPAEIAQAVEEISRAGGTPLVVAENAAVLGVVQLKDVVKGGIRERFAQLRQMGIRTVMVTGDNPLTAAAIAAEAGVDDFMAQATPEQKLARIRAEQAAGHLVAMTGDGTNDAPALAQADVGVAMNTGTQAAREAGNMVDLDSNPTKLLDIVETGKQMLITRGALTTFGIANDVAKYFALLPAMFLALYAAAGATTGPLATLNVMRLASPQSAILSAVIFNALIIIALIPLALRGVTYRPLGASALLRRNLALYGLGGLVAPFIGIKLVDLLVAGFRVV